MKATVTATSGLRVRAAPSSDGYIIDTAPYQSEVDVLGLEGDWAVVQLAAGGLVLQKRGYMSKTYLKLPEPPAPPPPAPVVSRHLIVGVHTSGDNGRAWDALSRGCRAFVILDDYACASELAAACEQKYGQGNYAVIARASIYEPITPDEMAAKIGKFDPRVWYVGVNEDDSIAQSDLASRFALDYEMGKRATAAGARWYGGSWSYGVPDWNDSTLPVLKQYIDAANAGILGIDQHSYYKDESLTDPAAWYPWLEGRWLQWTSHGFRGRMICTEWGPEPPANARGWSGEQVAQATQAFVARTVEAAKSAYCPLEACCYYAYSGVGEIGQAYDLGDRISALSAYFAPVDLPQPPEQVAEPPAPAVDPATVLIDVSSHQGVIDWQAVAGSGVNAAYIRAGYGASADDAFARNWSAAKAAGIARGAYYALWPDVDCSSQVARFLSLVGPDRGELPPVLDVEVTRGRTQAQIVVAVRQWLEAVESGTGRRPVVYTGAWWWNPNLGYQAWACEYPLWAASYTTTIRLPMGWTEAAIWQYTDAGAVPGIAGAVDRNRTALTLGQLKAL